MPISATPDLSATHWQDVQQIFVESVSTKGFEAKLVSQTEHTGVILKQIVERLYKDPIVICDVSTKNANVMFELGIRLAFDKPTVIVKDDVTGFSFDTGVIEHLVYPRDLRYSKINEFKDRLADKVIATLRQSEDPNYTTFLKHFGTFKVPKLETEEIPIQTAILEALSEIKRQITAQSREREIVQLSNGVLSISRASDMDRLAVLNEIKLVAREEAEKMGIIETDMDSITRNIEVTLRKSLGLDSLVKLSPSQLREIIRDSLSKIFRLELNSESNIKPSSISMKRST